MLTANSPAMMEESEVSARSVVVPGKSQRVVSIDALRGLDMLCILGLTGLVVRISELYPKHWLNVVAGQLEHKDWDGIAFEDLIFPTFVFLVGASLVFSLGRLIQTRGKGIAVRRILLRSIALFLFGILYNSGIGEHYSDIRLMGVLQRIALAYLGAGLMFCFLSRKAMVAVGIGILAAYWVLLTFVPVPGVKPHSFDEGKNWPNYVDAHYLPLHKYDGDHDPEGYLSSFPAVVTCLLGVFAGMLIKSDSVRPYAKVGWLLLGGTILLALGYAWGLEFPIIKKLWTSSYVLAAGGYSALALGLFYLGIDVWNLKRWASPLVWVGMNAITFYLFNKLFGFYDLAERCIGGQFKQEVLRQYGPLAVELLAMVFLLALARFLYTRKIFLRV